MTNEELEKMLSAPTRFDPVTAIALMKKHALLRESAWLTSLLLQCVERSGYDRGYAVHLRETEDLKAPEPAEIWRDQREP